MQFVVPRMIAELIFWLFPLFVVGSAFENGEQNVGGSSEGYNAVFGFLFSLLLAIGFVSRVLWRSE